MINLSIIGLKPDVFWIIVLLIICNGASIWFAWRKAKNKYSEFKLLQGKRFFIDFKRIFFGSQHDVYVDFIRVKSIFWSSLITSLSVLILLFPNWILGLPGPTSLISSPGIIYSLIALFVAFYTYFNTVKIERAQFSKVDTLKTFLKEINTLIFNIQVTFHHWRQQDQKPQEKSKDIFIMDYTPFIGSISLSESRIYELYKTSLLDICSNEYCNVKILCHDDDHISKYYKQVGGELGRTEYIEKIKDQINGLETDHQNGGCRKDVLIIRTKKIPINHLFIVDNTAFQYLITPNNKKKGSWFRRNSAKADSSGVDSFSFEENNIIGYFSKDLFTMKMLRETFDKSMQEALTPLDFVDNKTNITFHMTKQNNIEKVEIIVESESGRIVDQDKITYIEHNGYIVSEDTSIKDKYIRIGFLKKGHSKAQYSNLYLVTK
jgi:hypothetical protein